MRPLEIFSFAPLLRDESSSNRQRLARTCHCRSMGHNGHGHEKLATKPPPQCLVEACPELIWQSLCQRLSARYEAVRRLSNVGDIRLAGLRHCLCRKVGTALLQAIKGLRRFATHLEQL
jgi:hypothetical protein